MINSRKELFFYLDQDSKRFKLNHNNLINFILRDETWFISIFQKNLRFLEYYENTNNSILFFYFHFLIHKWLSYKLRCTVYPNTTKYGFRIYGIGDFTHVSRNCKIGTNCSIMSGVVIGNKKLEEDKYSYVVIGNNCIIGYDVRILGNVNIGNNVIISSHSVS